MSSEPAVSLAYGNELLRYDFGPDHPMNRKRIAAFFRLCRESGMLKDPRVSIVTPRMATEGELLLFHTPEYVELVRQSSTNADVLLDDEDTPAFKGVYEASKYVVGTTLECLERTVEGQRYAFNPMGGLHHARKDHAAGFCVFNDIGVAIETARRNWGLRRILYIDIDAHHGDGVMYAYYDDPAVLVLDFHEDGRSLYPGTGSEGETGGPDALGSKRNVPLPPGADDDYFRSKLETVSGFLRDSKPELVILQAGADSIRGDPIADLSLSNKTHGLIAQTARKIADRQCSGRLLVLGGGGYNPKNTSEAWISVLHALLAE
ncbi:MAG TPA: acetoin utilization protein AcuC [Thermoproteota archaeon]|nr:acetoin utilization protein AcuC [Thermoproteota archaeon]